MQDLLNEILGRRCGELQVKVLHDHRIEPGLLE